MRGKWSIRSAAIRVHETYKKKSKLFQRYLLDIQNILSFKELWYKLNTYKDLYLY